MHVEATSTHTAKPDKFGDKFESRPLLVLTGFDLLLHGFRFCLGHVQLDRYRCLLHLMDGGGAEVQEIKLECETLSRHRTPMHEIWVPH